MKLPNYAMIVGSGIGSNIDNAALGTGLGTKRRHVGLMGLMLMTGVSFVVVMFGGMIGGWMAIWLSVRMTAYMGSAAVAGVGSWMVWGAVRSPSMPSNPNDAPRAPDHHALGFSEMLAISGAAAVNDWAIGFYASSVHVRIWVVGITVALFSGAFLYGGWRLGWRLTRWNSGHLPTIVAGCLLIAIALGDLPVHW